jgi:hypothetical protein
MILRLTLLGLFQIALLRAAESPDLLRFTNGDQLHGTFQAIHPGSLMTWLREDLSEPVVFKSNLLRHIVLRQGRPAQPLASLASVSLINGDRIPGMLTDLNQSSITLQTSLGDALTIPRDQVTMLAPSPTGGRLQYYGPFSEDGWKMVSPTFPDGLPPPSHEDTESVGRWVFSGASWIWPGKIPNTALLRENALPARSIIRFDLDWKNQLFVAIAFHADFTKPKPPSPDDPPRRPGGFTPGDPAVLPLLFGNSYVLQLFTTHISLFRTSINEDGKGAIDRIQLNGNPIRIGDAGKASVEIRCNRPNGEIALFINGEFVVQWSDPTAMQPGPAPDVIKGNGLGFLVQTHEAAVKLSDLMIAEWNGMPDSARSLQVDEQDIILLANGTDRFSGRVTAFENDQIHVAAKLGNFQIPLAEIAEIRFAKNQLATPAEPSPENLTIRFSPFGQISGVPLTGTSSAITLKHPAYGETTVRLDSAVMLEFHPPLNSIEDWDADH